MGDDIFGIVGTTQGPFTVEKVVAEGGFGVVYRAYHGAFRAPVALKCLKIPGEITPELRGRFLEQFREEGEMLFRLSAAIPAVVRPLHHDVISTATGLFVPFIALEWLDGLTLDNFISRRAKQRLAPLRPLEAAALLTPVARALDAAHHFPGPNGPMCVVHRDLKPANIFLADVHGTQVVKILDFGIARARDAASVIAGENSTTGSGVSPVAFTPRYGSPEQWAPKRFGATGPWTDVWGLALTFLELMLGRQVLVGDSMAIMGTTCDDKRRPTPRTEGLVVPDALEAAFSRALAVDPRHRQSHAGAFWDEIEQALGLPQSHPPIARAGRGLPARPRVDGAPGSRAMPRPMASATAPTMLAQPPGSSGRPSRPSNPDPLELELPQAGGPAPTPPGGVERVGASPRTAASPVSPPAEASPWPGGRAPSPSPSDPGRPPLQRRPGPFELSPPSRPASVPLALDLGADGSRPRARPLLGGQYTMAPQRPTAPDLKDILGLPLRLAGVGVLISIIDQVAASLLLGGDRIGFGPFKLLWLAVTLLLVSMGLAAFKLFTSTR